MNEQISITNFTRYLFWLVSKLTRDNIVEGGVIMSITITNVVTHDLRFPTSQTFAGSDAMHPDPDYSAAYVILETDAEQGLEGHGLTFTIGRGNEVCVAAITA